MNVHTLSINSKNRTSGDSSDFTINLVNGISNISKFAIGSVVIPKTYYNITDLNNNFRFIDSTLTTYDLSIPEGNYDIFQIITWLDVNMNLLSPDTFHFNLNQITNKIDICQVNSWQLDFSTITNTIAKCLGFEDELYTSSLNGIGNQGIFAPNSPDVQRTNQVFITCTDIHRQNYTLNGNQAFGHILTSVNDNVDFGNFINKREQFNILYKFSGNNFISSIRIKLIDDNGEKIDLNNVDWSMEVHFIL
jgi:hypothetical protein